MAQHIIAFNRRKPIEGGMCLDFTDDGCWVDGKQVLEYEGKPLTKERAIEVGLLTGTNWGITSPVYAKFLGKKRVTRQEMENMPEEHAIVIAKKNYWDIFRGDEINHQGIANDLYDAAFNQGLVTGIRQIQEAADLPITGRMDDNTIKHLNNNE